MARTTIYLPHEFRRLVDEIEARLTADVLRILDEERLRLAVSEIERVLETQGEAAAADLSRRISTRIGDAARRAFEAAAVETASALSSALDVTIDFEALNSGAIAAIRANQLRLVREIVGAQRQTIRDVLTRGVTAGLNPREVAREVRDSIGLTAYQSRVVAAYRRNLEDLSQDALGRQLRDRRFDPTVRSAIESGQSLSRTQINQMVDRYRERWVNYRAETIARTEALRAANEGAEEMIDQAIQAGVLQPDDLVRRWNTADDDRVRDSHESMHGQERDVGEPFETGDGFSLMYPGDPDAPGEETINCRCVVSTRFRRAVG